MGIIALDRVGTCSLPFRDILSSSQSQVIPRVMSRKFSSEASNVIEEAEKKTLGKLATARMFLQYTCKVCSHVTRHDVEEIARHVDSHFLSLDMYGKLYERNIQQIREKRRQEEARKETEKTKNIKSKSDADDPTEKRNALCEKASNIDNVEKETIDKEKLEI